MKSPWNRREFIARPLALLAASSLLSKSELLHAATPASSTAAGGIVQRTLGRTGIQLPVVSMGVMNANMPAVVKRAYEMGIRHFDTAARYQDGRNEEMVGQVIKELGVRDKVTIATKAWIHPSKRMEAGAKEQIRSIFEGSLKRLQMDHVDILYFHAIDSADEARSEFAIQVLNDLKKEGKTRFIGLSTHTHQEQVLNEAVKAGAYDVALVGINYTMAANKGLLDAIDNAAKKGMGIVAMKTQAGGTTKPDPKLPSVLPPHSQTALLKWVLQNPSITTAVPGFTNFDQLEQNFSVARDLAFTPAEKEFLADKSFRAQAEFCVQCGKCREDCPLRAEIPTLMRSHMYAVQYANRGLARETLASIGSGKGLDACASCASCRANCRETVNIARKIAELKAITAAGVLEA
jgi:hypothetical protein